MSDIVQLYGMKDGVQVHLGAMTMPPKMKAREIARGQFGHFEDDDGSDAELCYGAMEELINWMESSNKPTLEIATAFSAEQKRRADCYDDLLRSLQGLHHVCQLALAGKNGKQYSNFESRAGHFISATPVMVAAESAITKATGVTP